MGKRVQFIRHTTGNADVFVGFEGEITVDKTAKELRVHDGLTPGGIAVARKDLANVANVSTSIAGKMPASRLVELIAATTNIAKEIVDRIADVDAEEARASSAEALLIPLTQRATANGVATLDASSKVEQTALTADTLIGLSAQVYELNAVNGSTIASNITAVFSDRVVFNDGGTMKQVNLKTLALFFNVRVERLQNKTLVSPKFEGGQIVTCSVSSAGVLTNAPLGWSISKGSTGAYTLNHGLGLTAVATQMLFVTGGGGGTYLVMTDSVLASNSYSYFIRNVVTNSAVDADHKFFFSVGDLGE